MRKLLIWVMAFIILAIAALAANSVNTTIQSPVNKTYYLNSLPNNISVNYTVSTNGVKDTCLLNPTFYDGMCYQESANVSTTCGGLSSGTYIFEPDVSNTTWLNPFNIIDGNWSTNGYKQDAGAKFNVSINYTIPANALGAFWQIKDEDGIKNLTIPAACWNTTRGILILQARTTQSSPRVSWQCWDDVDYLGLRNYTLSNAIYEEAVWWNITNIATGGTNLGCLNTTKLISAAGSYNDTIWVNLATGENNYTSVYYTVEYDNTLPEISIATPPDVSYVYNLSQNITYPATFTASDLNKDSCWYNYNGTTTHPGNCDNFTMTLNGYKQYNLTIWVNDTAGNINSATSKFIIANLTINTLLAVFYDEETGLQLTTPFTLEVIGPRYSTKFNGSNNYSLNNLLTDIYNLRYWGENYAIRNYYVNISQGSNQTIKLFVLNSSNSQLTLFTISDTAGIAIAGATISMLRKMIPTNTWEIVEMAQSDTNGQGTLTPYPSNVNYMFRITDTSGSLVFSSTTPQVIPSNLIYFKISTISTMQAYWNLVNVLKSNISFNNATSTTIFGWSDSSNSVTIGNLVVIQTDSTQSSVICNTSLSAASGILTCDLSAYKTDTHFTYRSVGSVKANGTWYEVQRYDKTFASVQSLWGINGAFLALLIILTLACMGLWNPSACLIFTGIGILISVWFGLIPLSALWLTGILALIAIAIWKMRT